MATSVRNGDGMSQLQSINHIVVLMLENRSFDCLLGKLYPKSDTFEGLSGSEQNPDAHGGSITVWNNPGSDEATMRIPNPDPGELWTDINTQLFGGPSAPRPGQVPTMDGFVRNYLAQQPLNPTETYDPKSVMHYFTPDQVPVLSALAKQFALCDRWFAAAPCQTWPNRWFAHAATADGHETIIRRTSPMCQRSLTAWNRRASTIGKSTFTILRKPTRCCSCFCWVTTFTRTGSFRPTARATRYRPILSSSPNTLPTSAIRKTTNIRHR